MWKYKSRNRLNGLDIYMYTLRSVNKSNAQSNTFLGHYYEFISKQNAPEVFTESQRLLGFANGLELLGIVRDGNGGSHPLYLGNDHFIMTESGKTFERLN